MAGRGAFVLGLRNLVFRKPACASGLLARPAGPREHPRSIFLGFAKKSDTFAGSRPLTECIQISPSQGDPARRKVSRVTFFWGPFAHLAVLTGFWRGSGGVLARFWRGSEEAPPPSPPGTLIRAEFQKKSATHRASGPLTECIQISPSQGDPARRKVSRVTFFWGSPAPRMTPRPPPERPGNRSRAPVPPLAMPTPHRGPMASTPWAPGSFPPAEKKFTAGRDISDTNPTPDPLTCT